MTMPTIDYTAEIRAGAASKALQNLEIPRDPSQQTPLHRRLVEVWGDGVRRWEPGICRVCAARLPDEEPVEFAGAQLGTTVCDRCYPLVQSHYEAGAQQQVQTRSWWQDACPPLYQRLVNGGLPDHCDREAYARVAGWDPDSGRGIIALGESGAGKTTALWALARRLEERGIRPVVMSAIELARAMGKSAYDLKRDHYLTGCRVLIVDDLGKERLTPGVSALLWELVEARYANDRSVIVSTRYTGDEFESRFGDKSKGEDGLDRYILGRDIRRRLSQMCKPIMFRPAVAKA